MKVKVLNLVLLILFANSIKAQNVFIPDALFKSCLLADTLININGDDEIQISEAEATFNISCINLGIESLEGIEHFINLADLECYENSISELHLSKNIKLRELRCSDNEIDSLTLTNNIGLRSLSAWDNNISYLDISQNNELTHVHLSNNKLTELDVSHLPELFKLVCFGNEISTINVTNAPKLIMLWINENLLTSLDLSGCFDLRYLDVSNNNLNQLDVRSNTKLEGITCTGVDLTNLDVSQNLDLIHLFASRNNLTSLNLNNNKKLQSVSCGNNKLIDIKLDSATSIVRLNLKNNELRSLNLQNQHQLEAVYATSNHLEYANLACGNNINFYRMNIDSNDLLYCIKVDNNLNLDSLPDFWLKDTQASYNQNCCNLLNLEIEDTICEGQSYTGPSGQVYYDFSETILDTVYSEIGCDSIFSINLSELLITNEVTQQNGELYSFNNAEAYTWIDCQTNMIIEGESESSFLPSISGNYAVEILQNGCYHTSACFEYLVTSNVNIPESKISVFPNPTSDYIYISQTNPNDQLKIVIKNNLNQIIGKATNLKAHDLQISLETDGIYYINIFSGSKLIETQKVVKF